MSLRGFLRSLSATLAVLAIVSPNAAQREISYEKVDAPDSELSPLERQLTLKLRTAARVRRNIGKILARMPWTNYELFRSIRLLDEYLRSGGSLLDCLEDLPALAFLPLDRQIAGIMASMEDRLPRHLVPSVSLIARSLSTNGDSPEDTLDANDLYQPDFGPLRVDLFDGLTLGEVRDAGLPSFYAVYSNMSNTSNSNSNSNGAWPKLLGDACTMIATKTIVPRGALLAHLIENLRLNGGFLRPPPGTRVSVARVVQALLRDFRGGKGRVVAKSSLDPYELARNVLISLERNASRLRDTSLLRAHLKTRETRGALCPGISGSSSFPIGNGSIDYARLFELLDDELRKSKSASILLQLVVHDSDVIERPVPFYPLEYETRRDLLFAVVSRLRRARPSLESTEAVYGALSSRTARKRWRFLRNGRNARTILRALARRTAGREPLIAADRRLYAEAAAKLEGTEDEPLTWRRALVYAVNQSKEPREGPLAAVHRALGGLVNGEMVPQRAMSTIEQLLARQEVLERDRSACINSILAASFARAEDNRTRGETSQERPGRIAVADLLQALPTLDLYSDEYQEFEAFLSRDTLEKDLRVGLLPAIEEYPTRGRFLSWVLGVIEGAPNVSEKLRRLAGRFIDFVAYEGFGAGPVQLRPAEN